MANLRDIDLAITMALVGLAALLGWGSSRLDNRRSFPREFCINLVFIVAAEIVLWIFTR
jgi:hypothetical protein